jgi:pimeloyl-ACP methyl ester carboxylesterase
MSAPVVLLHGSASSSGQWRTLSERLGDRFRVMAPDLQGYGAAPHWTGRGAFRLEHEAQVVCAALAGVGEPAHLVGHSFGGAVALHIARTRPELLASLTVIEPAAFHLLRGVDDAAMGEVAAVAASIGEALLRGDYFGGIEEFVDYWGGPGAWQAIPEERRPAFAAKLAKVVLDFEAAFNEPATLRDFSAMRLPTLVLQGERSPWPAVRICRLLAGTVPAAQIRVIAGAGHLVPLTHRGAVNALVVGHLEAHPGRRSRVARPQISATGTAASGALAAAG